jgi:hypothetical protein
MQPGGAERQEDAAARLEEPAHGVKDALRVTEVLEAIDRHDDVSLFVGLGDELAAIRHTSVRGGLAGGVQRVVHDIDADDAGSPALRQLDRLGPGPAPEVDDDLPCDAAPEALSEEDLELASATVGTAIAVALPGGPFPETTQQMIRKGSTDESSSHRLHLLNSRTVEGRTGTEATVGVL